MADQNRKPGSAGSYLRGGGVIDPNALLLERMRAKDQNLQNMVSNGKQRLAQAMQKSGINFSRDAMIPLAATAAAAAPLAGQVIQDVQAGRTLDAAVTGGVGLGVLEITEAAGKAVGGGKGAAIRAVGAVAAPLIGNVLGNKAEQMRSESTGVAPANASPVEQRRADITRIKQDAQLQAELIATGMTPYVAQQKDLMQYASDLFIENEKKLDPIIAKRLNDALVRQQALNASNAQNYMAMGTVATAGKLATGLQAEMGANLRTAMQANPYANSVLQAPNISF
jgi:hypothetical protein